MFCYTSMYMTHPYYWLATYPHELSFSGPHIPVHLTYVYSYHITSSIPHSPRRRSRQHPFSNLQCTGNRDLSHCTLWVDLFVPLSVALCSRFSSHVFVTTHSTCPGNSTIDFPYSAVAVRASQPGSHNLLLALERPGC